MMPGAERDPVLTVVPAAARPEDDVMIVELPPRGANRDRAAPPVAGEHRIAMPWLALPFRFPCTSSDSSPPMSEPCAWAAKARMAVRKSATTATGAENVTSASGNSHSGRVHNCRSSSVSDAPGGGGSMGATPSRTVRAHSTSSASRRTGTAPARSTQAAAVGSATMGSKVSARTQDSSPALYAVPNASACHVFRSTRPLRCQRGRRHRSPISSRTVQPDRPHPRGVRAGVPAGQRRTRRGTGFGVARREFLLTGGLYASLYEAPERRRVQRGGGSESDRGGYVNFWALMIPMRSPCSGREP